MKILRWILVAPMAVAAWYATFFLAIGVHQAVENWACPEAQWISGVCLDANVRQVLEVVVVMSIALSAVAVVLAATFTAPAHKAVTAWVVFAAGAVVGAFFAVTTEMYVAGIAAALAGLGTAAAVTRWSQRR